MITVEMAVFLSKWVDSNSWLLCNYKQCITVCQLRHQRGARITKENIVVPNKNMPLYFIYKFQLWCFIAFRLSLKYTHKYTNINKNTSIMMHRKRSIQSYSSCTVKAKVNSHVYFCTHCILPKSLVWQQLNQLFPHGFIFVSLLKTQLWVLWDSFL